MKQIACPNGLDEHFDPVEFTTTGGTSLRYSEEVGQFMALRYGRCSMGSGSRFSIRS